MFRSEVIDRNREAVRGSARFRHFGLASLAIGLAAILFQGSAAIAAEPATPMAPATPLAPQDQVPADALTRLGFDPAATPLTSESYAQLRIAVFVPNGQTQAKMDHCPDKGVWDFDLSNLTKGDKTTTLGLTLTGPGFASPVTLNPLNIKKYSSGWFGLGSSCSISVDVINYTSSVYYVRTSAGQFTISPVYATTAKLGTDIANDLNSLVTAASTMAGVTAVAAAPYLAQIKNQLDNAQNSGSQTWIQHPTIQAGAAQPIYTWELVGVIQEADGTPPGNLFLVAQLVAAPPIIPAPAGGAWTSGDVLNAAFNLSVPSNPAPTNTLGAYISSKFSADLQAYTSANTDDAANLACGTVSRDIQGVGLSDRETALTVWAEAKQRVVLTRATDATVDNMTCLSNQWPFLIAAGITKTPLPPTPPVQPIAPAGQFPTVAQMQQTIEINDALARMLVKAAWTDQGHYIDQVLSYPMNIIDAQAVMTRGSAAIPNQQAWLLNEFQRDSSVLSQVGCYAYFDINADPSRFAAQETGASMMFAIGVLPTTSPQPGKEVALRLSFGQTPGGNNTKVTKLEVLNSITPTEKAAILSAIGSPTQCPSGNSPAILFTH
jgi:hypothetical protein